MKIIMRVLLLVLLLLSSSIFSYGGDSGASHGDIVLKVREKNDFGAFKVEKIIREPSFAVPISGTVDKDGNIYVLDRKVPRLFKFSAKGDLLKSAGRRGNGPGEFVLPVITRYRDSKLYIFDFNQPLVNIFDKDLTFLEQKKFPNLRNVFDIRFVNQDEFIVTSPVMAMMLNHRLFLFSMKGNMVGKFAPYEEKKPKAMISGGEIKMKYPDLICFDEAGSLWSAGLTPYIIKAYEKDYKIKKSLKGDITFKFQENDAGRGRARFQAPVDRGIFLNVTGGKIYYGYKYDDQVILDIVGEDKVIDRFRSSRIDKIFFMIKPGRFLVSFNDEEPAVAIVSIKPPKTTGT